MSRPVHLLSGDIGGTKCLLALSRLVRTAHGVTLETVYSKRYASADWPGLEPLVRHFLQSCHSPSITAACFGIAGPIEHCGDVQHSSLTNLSWRLDSDQLSKALAIPRVELINDFAAVAYAIDHLTADQLLTLQPGTPSDRGTRLIVGAGTGLGLAHAVTGGHGNWRILSGEGGHVDFAPTSADEIALLQYMWQRHDRVSSERLLSGAGLAAILAFCRQQAGSDSPALLDALQADQDPAAVATGLALDGHDPVCSRAVELFLRIYGAYAGNAALFTLPAGGVYIAGGIAARIPSLLRSGPFLTAFNAKGRMAPLMARLPVYLIMDPSAGLLGCTQRAAKLAQH